MVAVRRDGLVVEAVHDEVLVFNPERSEATALNQSAALVFELCDGDHTVESIREALDAAGLGPATDDAVWLALDELDEAGLVELQVPRAQHLGRRELLKQYGFGAAALAALPVVETITAPSAATAGSPVGGDGGQTPPATTTSTTTTTTTTSTTEPQDTTTTTTRTPAPTAAPTTTTTTRQTPAPTTPAPTPRPTPSPTTTTTTTQTPAPATPGPTPRPTPRPTVRPTPSPTTSVPSTFAPPSSA